MKETSSLCSEDVILESARNKIFKRTIMEDGTRSRERVHVFSLSSRILPLYPSANISRDDQERRFTSNVSSEKRLRIWGAIGEAIAGIAARISISRRFNVSLLHVYHAQTHTPERRWGEGGGLRCRITRLRTCASIAYISF